VLETYLYALHGVPVIIKLTPEGLVRRIREDGQIGAVKVRRSLNDGADRALAHVKKVSPVDKGDLQAAWEVVNTFDGVELHNSQPYAGIIEVGTRPFRISKVGREALEAWAMRKLQQGVLTLRDTDSSYAEAARRISWGIAKKFEQLGLQGKYYIRDLMPMLSDIMIRELNRTIEKFFSRPAR